MSLAITLSLSTAMDGIFSFSSLEAERICRNAFPLVECRAERGAKYFLSFMLFSLAFLGLYCLSSFLSLATSFIQAVFGLQQNKPVAAYISF